MDATDVDELCVWVDPFEKEPLNCNRQTGADWYRLALSASYGGKSIHGVDITPSCELITRVDEDFAKKHATGRINFSPEVMKAPAMGSDITELPYANKDYTGTGSFFAFDQGMWEPNARKTEDACEVVSRITGDDNSKEAVDIANIPVSHLKREALAVSKPSHKVFSCGTIQRAITWDDNQLVAEKYPPHAAVDWARITTIARYIGEFNCQIDPSFAEYAQTRGVPYSLVHGAGAHVTDEDYVVSADLFANVPKVDLEKYTIPTLKDSYSHAADSILKQCYVNLNRLSYEEAASDASTLVEIIDKCKMRIRGSVPIRTNKKEAEKIKEWLLSKRNRVDNATMNMSEADLAELAQFSSTFEFWEDLNAPASYNAVTSSYDTAAVADEYARANGYANFDEAYAALGEGARYDPETPYTRTAMAHRA